ncbi:hypothetical protein EV714DRAFT_241765 [Schizophyllum commune]
MASQRCVNSSGRLCDKSFGNVSFVGAHDSYAVGTDNLAVNQDYDGPRRSSADHVLPIQSPNN